MSERPKIMAVDDEPEDLALLVRLLTSEGYEVDPAATGELALAAAVRHPPDLVLCDIEMPGMNGLELCRRLKAGEQTRHIPIILMGASRGEGDAAACPRNGAADYVSKPVRAASLLARVATHLALSRSTAELRAQAAALSACNEQVESEITRRQHVEAELRHSLDQAELSRQALPNTLEDRKQAENALRESEVRYRRLFEAAKDGILILDAETGVVDDVNPFLLELLGSTREGVIGQTIWDLGFLRDIAANKASFAELLRHDYVRYDDKPLQTAGGQLVDVEFVSNV